jgi:hypothetical protein
MLGNLERGGPADKARRHGSHLAVHVDRETRGAVLRLIDEVRTDRVPLLAPRWSPGDDMGKRRPCSRGALPVADADGPAGASVGGRSRRALVTSTTEGGPPLRFGGTFEFVNVRKGSGLRIWRM